MVTLDGEVKGQHDGLMYYTIGQRQDWESVAAALKNRGLLSAKI